MKCILRDAAAVVSDLKYRLVSYERNGKRQLRHASCVEYSVFQKIQQHLLNKERVHGNVHKLVRYLCDDLLIRMLFGALHENRVDQLIQNGGRFHDLHLRPGEVMALLGENGAGKSTLVKILSGVYTRDSGEMEIGGTRIEGDLNTRQAQKLGVAIIHQELNMCQHLTVAAKVEIYEIINDLKKRGIGVIVVSSEMPEVMGISGRILVMCDGRVTSEVPGEGADKETIMIYATQFEVYDAEQAV